MLLQMLSQMPADLTKSELTEYIKSGNKSIKWEKRMREYFTPKGTPMIKQRRSRSRRIYIHLISFFFVCGWVPCSTCVVCENSQEMAKLFLSAPFF